MLNQSREAHRAYLNNTGYVLLVYHNAAESSLLKGTYIEEKYQIEKEDVTQNSSFSLRAP